MKGAMQRILVLVILLNLVFSCEKKSNDPDLVAYVAVAANGHCSLALKNDGSVWEWGRDSHDALLPDKVGEGYIDITTGWGHSFALKADGTVWSWGWNSYCQLWDGTSANKDLPVLIDKQNIP